MWPLGSGWQAVKWSLTRLESDWYQPSDSASFLYFPDLQSPCLVCTHQNFSSASFEMRLSQTCRATGALCLEVAAPAIACWESWVSQTVVDYESLMQWNSSMVNLQWPGEVPKHWRLVELLLMFTGSNASKH